MAIPEPFSIPVDANGNPVVILADAPVAGKVDVATTATKLPTTPKTGRTSLLLRNNGSATVFLGPAGVTTATGYPLKTTEILKIEVTDKVDIYGIVASGTEEVRILEG